MKFISTGGLGDAFIAFLKLKDQEKLDSWLHVESNDLIRRPCEMLFGVNNGFFEYDFLFYPSFSFECDPGYIQSYKEGKWKDFAPVSSGQDFRCPLKGHTEVEMKNPFINILSENNFDVCIQAAAGAKNSRKWLFSPVDLARILRQKGMRVAIVGTDQDSFDLKDNDNFVGKYSIDSSLCVINGSKYFIGLSGFLNYYACATKSPNAHLIESDEHEKRYYHPEWKSDQIRVGSLGEVLRLINEKVN